MNGVTYIEDMPAMECTMSYLLLPAIKKAGRNLTWDKVYANLLSTTKAKTAYMSNGEGGYGKNKPYLVNQMHLVTLTAAKADTPQGAGGTFNGCPIPANCWVTRLVNGREWFPIASAAG